MTMKKLLAFIQMLMNMLSAANKEIFRLRTEVCVLEVMRKTDINYLNKQIDELKHQLAIFDKVWVEKFKEDERKEELAYYEKVAEKYAIEDLELSEEDLIPWYKTDKEYADWCLFNNWLKLDKEAGIFVCGEDIFDDIYEEELIQ